MAFDSKQFYEDLIKDAKLTDEQKVALQSALTDSTISKRLEEGTMRQSDYSRQVAEAQAKAQEALSFRSTLVDWQEQELARLEAERAALGVKPTQPAVLQGDYLSKKEFDERLKATEGGAIGLMGQMATKAIAYLQDYGKPLDVDAVIRKAQETGRTFSDAFDIIVQPEKEAKQKVEFETRIKREREEAAKEAIANLQIPTGTTQYFNPANQQLHPIDAAASKGTFGWKTAAEAHGRDIMANTVKYDH